MTAVPTADQIFDVIAVEISNHAKLDRSEIGPQSALNELGVDSLALIDILYRTSDGLVSQFPNVARDFDQVESLPWLETVGDIAEFFLKIIAG